MSPDPVFFETACAVSWQQIGGAPKADVIKMLAAGVALRPITIDPTDRATFVKLLERNPVPPSTLADSRTVGSISTAATTYRRRSICISTRRRPMHRHSRQSRTELRIYSRSWICSGPRLQPESTQ
jgi:hypothetical protein